MSDGFKFSEKYLSQIPALQQLIALGFKYLTHVEAVAERQGRFSNVLLEEILRKQLKEINHIQYRGREYLFSEENVQTAIQKLKNITWDVPHKTNEAVYDLLSLGTALEQSVEGDTTPVNQRKHSFFLKRRHMAYQRSTGSSYGACVAFCQPNRT